jgi:hypothetical protein
MTPNASEPVIREIMDEFAALTGLTSEKAPQRYLWTDAFAVCNFLELYRQTKAGRYRQLTLRLVDQVHNVLGRHRKDDPRTGWISGLDEQEGRLHPTIGGLRIGKKLNERRPTDEYDERLEWDRDGQYYHYLTKWMHALNRVSQVTGDLTYNLWAVELARTAHARFTYVPSSGGRKRMYWKMSIDLANPLVPSMGQHDPLDGYITYHELQATARHEESRESDLKAEISDMAQICEGRSWVTDDPLGTGGLLSDAYRVAGLMVDGALEPGDLLETLLDSSWLSLEACLRMNILKLPVDYRLAFRELGLSIGLRAIERLPALIEEKPGAFDERAALRSRIERLMQNVPLAEEIEEFWLKPAHRETESWTAHRDINMVMLATSLAPDGYLGLW